jgi:GNAT superfamily N-acetyltransferase
MAIAARLTELAELAPMREDYRREMNCQIIHDSIHRRPGWSREYALEIDGALAGYGSVAMAGPWTESNALYEFYVRPEYRTETFRLFDALLAECGAVTVETQSNDPLLTPMLHTFTRNVRAESILFRDDVRTSLAPPGAAFRAVAGEDSDHLWTVTQDGEVAGTGGILWHYNPPYGDIHMEIAEPFRRRGLGSYLVQELKAVCRAGGKIPGARCGIENKPSRLTLQRAGFVPCGHIVVGDLR